MAGNIVADKGQFGAVTVTGKLCVNDYVDDSATAGDRTVNAQRGKNAFAQSASAVTVTNNRVTANSLVLCSLERIDATLVSILTVVPGAGSFVVTGNTTATADTKFGWVVINL